MDNDVSSVDSENKFPNIGVSYVDSQRSKMSSFIGGSSFIGATKKESFYSFLMNLQGE
jgi:hypothetical protein